MIDMNFELYIDGGKISGEDVVNHPQIKSNISYSIEFGYDPNSSSEILSSSIM